MSSVSAVLLAAKEAKNLEIMLPLLHEILQGVTGDYEILVVDTAKPLDNAQDVCAQYDVMYIPQEEPGYGGAFRTGVKYASKEKLLFLDCDFSHDPNVIPELYAKSEEGYNVVIGSRYTKGGKSDGTKSAKLMSLWLNLVFRTFLGIKAKDISTSYRIYVSSQVKSIQLKCVNYDILEEVLFILKQNYKDFVIAEVPIHFKKRYFGESKRRLLRFIVAFLKTLFHLFFKRITGQKS